MPSWYLVQTKRSGETVAETHLRRQGYEVYLPRLAQVVSRRGQWCERIVALFPRYLFLRVDEECQALGPVHSTKGVLRVVQFGQRYATVPDQIITMLKARADGESGVHRMTITRMPRPGATVKIAAGPFDGLEGIFERESGTDRVVVLINLLGRCTRVHVPVDSLLPAISA